MSLQNITIDDFDSVLSWSSKGDWATPDPSINPSWFSEPDVTEWHEATYHKTSVVGTSVFLNFTGKSFSPCGRAKSKKRSSKGPSSPCLPSLLFVPQVPPSTSTAPLDLLTAPTLSNSTPPSLQPTQPTLPPTSQEVASLSFPFRTSPTELTPSCFRTWVLSLVGKAPSCWWICLWLGRR